MIVTIIILVNSMEKALMGDPTETALIKGFFKKIS